MINVSGNARVDGNARVGGEAEINSNKDWCFIAPDLTVYRSRCAERYEIRNGEGELISLETLSEVQLAEFFDWFI